MSFLQPLLLAALPLVSLPIIIHLINQRRYQSIHWAAMMFLLAANRMARGYARLRQWLILLFRMMVIAGLVFTISRPLASGWLGITAGGRADTTIFLLDRSPSMQQQGEGVAATKLETGRQQLAETAGLIGSSRWILIESTTHRPRELDRPDALLNLPNADVTSAAADLPAMLEAAHNYIRANRSGRTEIWICSDLRQNDWNAHSSRWQTLRDGFLEFTQNVRFHLLAYPRTAPGNVALRVTRVEWRLAGGSAELLVSLLLRREGDAGRPVTVPVQFEMGGARSELTIELAGSQYELKDYRMALEGDQNLGWGRVSIPADANPGDNDFYFVFEQPAPMQTVIVADDPQAASSLQLAASIPPDPALSCAAEIVTIEQLATVPWDEVALLVWQAPLPTGEAAKLVESLVGRGGQVVFFPPRVPGSDAIFGARWQSWVDTEDGVAVDTWRGDQDLLAHTLSGAALPVGALRIRKYCELSGELTALATLRGGAPLLARVTTDYGGVYFCATTSAPGDSSLATEGVVLYVALQRALAAGAAGLGSTRQLVAGKPPADLPASWTRVSGAEGGLSSEFPYHRGVYRAGERLLAVNRAVDEEQAPILADARVTELFRGLDFARVDGRAGSTHSLVAEIWRWFLATMMVAMVIEAGLCLPKLRPRKGQQGQQGLKGQQGREVRDGAAA